MAQHHVSPAWAVISPVAHIDCAGFHAANCSFFLEIVRPEKYWRPRDRIENDQYFPSIRGIWNDVNLSGNGRSRLVVSEKIRA